MYTFQPKKHRNISSGKSEGRYLEPSQLRLQATGSAVAERNKEAVRPAFDFRLTKDTGVIRTVTDIPVQGFQSHAANVARRVGSGNSELSTGSYTREGFRVRTDSGDELDARLDTRLSSSRSSSASMASNGTHLPGDKVMVAESASAPGVPIIYRTPEERAANPDRLNLDRRRLTVCPILDGEEQLRLLNYQHNMIRKITNLQQLKKLIFLDLYDNQIEEITGLSPLKSLRVLMLGKNRIKRIEHLDSLEKLDVLDLHGNDIQVIEGLSHLTELRVLNLAGNRIEFVDNIAGMVSLAELNLRRNLIRSLTGVEKLPSLQRLFLSCNEIMSFDEVACLYQSVSLQEISLDGNPIATDQFYKQTILRHMQQIRQLDMKRVTEEEKRIASVMARKEEDRKRELNKISLMKEKRRQAITTAKKQWEMMQTTLMGKSNRLTKMPEIYASHVNSFPNDETEEDEEEQVSSPAIRNGANLRPMSAQSSDQALDGARMRPLNRQTAKNRSQSESRPQNPLSGTRTINDSQEVHQVDENLMSFPPSGASSNGLAELDNDTLTCYGPGSVDSLDRNWGLQAAGAVNIIAFKFIEFGDIVVKMFNKIRSKFPAACTYHFTANNIHGLDQLNALAQLRRIEHIVIEEEGNPVTQLSMWKSYLIFRLAHFAIKSINGKEVTSGDIVTAEKMFGTISQTVNALLPNSRLLTLVSEPRKKQIISDMKNSSTAASLSSPEPKAYGVESTSRAALSYSTVDQSYQKGQDQKSKKYLAHTFIKCLAKETYAADVKKAKLDAVWDKTFAERVQNICLEMSDKETYLKKSMDQLRLIETL